MSQYKNKMSNKEILKTKIYLNIPYEKRNGIKKVLKETFGHLVPKEILERDKLPLKTKEIHLDPIKKRMDNLKLWSERFGLE